MSAFVGAPPPEPGKLTVCERNAELLHEDLKQRRKSRGRIADYQKFDLTGAAIKSPQSLAQPLPRPAFLPVDDGILSRLQDRWFGSGCKGVLNEIQTSEEVPKILQQISGMLLKLVTAISTSKEALYSQKKIPKEELISTFCPIPNWSQSSVKAFSCHPHTGFFAAALKDDAIKIFSTNRVSSDFEPILKDKRQKDVSCISWRPLSAANLAVGCQKGTVLWILDPTSSGIRPGTNQNRFFSYPGHSPVTSLNWSTAGHLLASGSPNDSAVMVWDIMSQSSTPLRRVGSGISFLSWSPCERRLFVSSRTETFRIWETQKWNCEKWSNLNGCCQAACWSPCGSYLLFTVEKEASLYYLQFHDVKDGSKIDLSGSGIAVKCCDLSPFTWENKDEEICAGGVIQCMAWDPTASRLAVIFKENDVTQSYVALFRTRLTPVFEITPCGFIGDGVKGVYPLAVDFVRGYDKGALILVCWSSGIVSQVPLFFHTVHTPSLIDQTAEAVQIPDDRQGETVGKGSMVDTLYSIS